MILVLNLGLKSVRAIVFSESGKKLKSASMAVNTALRGDFVEQDPEEWWTKCNLVIKEALAERDLRRSITTLTVTSSSSCLVTLDRTFRPVGSAIMVSDKRARFEALQIGSMEGYRHFCAGKKNNLTSQPSLMAPKILWLRNHDREIYSQAMFFASPNDYLIHRITGVFVTDPLNAEKFFFDVDTNSYPEKLYEELGIPLNRLPPVAAIGTSVGSILPEVSEGFGFAPNQKINLVLSTYDAICAFMGSGVTNEGEGCVVSGTVSSFRVLSRKEPAAFNGGIFTQYDPTHEIFIVGGSNNLGGGLIEWAKQCFYHEERHAYEVMENEARQSLAGAHGVLLLPYLLGERAPHWDSNLRGVFFGLERLHQRKDLMRAVFESVGFSVRDIGEAIESQGITVGCIRFSGGLSRVSLVSELVADIHGKEVQVLEEFETTSLGAFIIAAISSGMYRNLEDASRVVKVREIFMPDVHKHEMYDSFYGLYKDIRVALKGCFEKRQELVEKIYFESTQRIENL